MGHVGGSKLITDLAGKERAERAERAERGRLGTKRLEISSRQFSAGIQLEIRGIFEGLRRRFPTDEVNHGDVQDR
eukprot:Skav221235  [mRNA]  locus=scaffold1136:214184:214408:+ [translate_table: standard]